jgi:AraC-like DNA-binding protein
MSEREEAYEAHLASPKFELVEQIAAYPPRADNAVIEPRAGLGSVPRPAPADAHRPILAALLLKLLNAAHEVLARDREQADNFIERATALVRAQVEHREAAADGAPAGSHLAPWQSRRVIEFVEANLTGTIRIENLAQTARLSVSYFSRAFRSDFGESPYGFVVRRRIERAQEMMLLTDEPLACIAIACGLADQAHLTRLFRRIVGASPASWRRSHHVPLH